MALLPLPNYLRTYREQSGFTQADMAFIIRVRDKSELSRFELGRREPPLRKALACENTVGVPVSKIFAGLNNEVAKETAGQMKRLTSRLQARTLREQAEPLIHKLQCLAQRIAGILTPNGPVFSKAYRPLGSRVLALDLHPRGFGYAVLEQPERLVDSGVRTLRGGKRMEMVVKRRIEPLLELWQPSVLVLPELEASKKHSQKRKIVSALAKAARRHKTPLRLIGREAAKVVGEQRLTRHAAASMVAERFSEIRRKLPPERKAWESTHYRMTMFTAVATALAYLAKKSPRLSLQTNLSAAL